MSFKIFSLLYSAVLQKVNQKKMTDTVSQSPATSQFLPYIHHLRGPAILFVVGVHARGGVADWASNPETHLLVQTFFDAVEGNGTVMFVFISGFLFQYLTNTYFNFKTYLVKKFKYIILPYLVISFPIIVFRMYQGFDSPALPAAFNNQNVVLQFLYYLFTGVHLSPFWFISMITLMYLSAPVLHRLDTRNFYAYIFPVILLVSMFTYRPEYNANPLLAYVHYLPLYMLGMWASAYKGKLISVLSKWFLPLVGIYFTISALDVTGKLSAIKFLSFEQVWTERILAFNFYKLRTIALCFIMLTIFYWWSDRKFQTLERIGDYTLGIYFVHFLYIMASRKLLSVLQIPVDFTLLTFFIYFLFVLFLSMITISFIKKLAGRYSRTIIGC